MTRDEASKAATEYSPGSTRHMQVCHWDGSPCRHFPTRPFTGFPPVRLDDDITVVPRPKT